MTGPVSATAIPLIQDGDRFDELEVWSAERLASWQLQRLQQVVDAARRRGGFWPALWDQAGVGPNDLRSLADLGRFPIVDKADVVAGDVAAGGGGAGADRAPVAFSTRGTSGEPLLVWLDAGESDAYVVPTMRGYWWAGFRPGMTALLMRPAWHRLAAMEAHAVVRLGGRPAFFWGSMSPHYVGRFIDAVDELEPRFVTTTAPMLVSALRRCEDEGLDPRQVFDSVQAVVVVGLPLTPNLRVFLRDRAGVADVFERSGTQEGAALDECAAHTAPHIHSDVCLLEVLDDDSRPVARGARGRLVVTKLITGGSPFVRYDTGDFAEVLPEACPCGRALDCLKIVGRPESSVTVAGRLVTAYDTRLCVEQDPELVGRLILLMRGASPDVLGVVVEGKPANPRELTERLAARFGAEVEVTWLGDARVAWGFRQVVDRSEVMREAVIREAMEGT